MPVVEFTITADGAMTVTVDGRPYLPEPFAPGWRREAFPTILDALTAQRPALARAEAQFIAHPATWLNGRRWEDEPPRTAGQTGATDTQWVFAGIPRPNELRFHDEDDT